MNLFEKSKISFSSAENSMSFYSISKMHAPNILLTIVCCEFIFPLNFSGNTTTTTTTSTTTTATTTTSVITYG